MHRTFYGVHGVLVGLVVLCLGFSACTNQDPLPAESSSIEESKPDQSGLSSGATLLPAPPPDRNLIAWYACNEGTGRIVRDGTVNTFDGMMEGAATWTNPGIEGSALHFVESGMVRFTERDMLNSVGALRYGTISLWFYYSGVPPRQEMVPLLYFGGDEDRPDKNLLVVEIGHPENEYLYFTIMRGNVLLQCFDTNFPMKKNRWYHFAAVVSARGNTGYLNGVELTNRHYNAGTPLDTEFFGSVPVKDMAAIGYGITGVARAFRSYNGNLDEVRLYDRALTTEEIQQIYNELIRR